MDKQEVYLTADGLKQLHGDLDDLTGTQRHALARRLRDAIKMGDLSENADYISAKEDQAFLEGKILDLEDKLRRAVIIEEPKHSGVVSVGSTVTIAEKGREPEVYTLVGAMEANPSNGQISNQSPIGTALMGKTPGDTVTVETPGGELVIRVISID